MVIYKVKNTIDNKCYIGQAIDFINRKIMPKGSNSKLSKKYLITFPDGHKKIIIGLRKFCRKYTELTRMCLIYCAQGKQKQHKGYMCEYV